MSLELEKAISGYESYINKNGISEEIINAYSQAANVAILSEKDIPFGLKISTRAKELIEKFVLQKTSGNIWELEKFSFENKTWYDILDKYYSILKIEAQNKVVDSGFLYLEKKRTKRTVL